MGMSADCHKCKHSLVMLFRISLPIHYLISVPYIKKLTGEMMIDR